MREVEQQRVEEARYQAERFLSLTHQYESWDDFRSRDRAAALRSSLDLSNSLSELRKGRYA